MQRYWNGHEWTHHVAVLIARNERSAARKVVSLEKIVGLPFTLVFAGLALICAVAGEWKAVGGVAVLAVLVGAPILLILLIVRRTRSSHQNRADQRRYQSGLIARFDQETHATPYGDVHPAAPGVFQPTRIDLDDVPDAANQMIEQAWQPEVGGPSHAVRPGTPAPWHVVTQFPTRQFRKQAEDGNADDSNRT